jgi:hypothetical protein
MNKENEMAGKEESLLAGLNIGQKILTFVIIIAWITIFLSGILINSAPYRDMITNSSSGQVYHQQISMVAVWLIVILCYTPTNVILLSMTAGLLGALARIARLHVPDENNPILPKDETNPLLSGILRGVFVYLMVISGVLVIYEEPLTNPSQIQYLRLAGLLSLLSFILSYNPGRFRDFMIKGYQGFEKKLDNK